jgi:hypothetical protein
MLMDEIELSDKYKNLMEYDDTSTPMATVAASAALVALVLCDVWSVWRSKIIGYPTRQDGDMLSRPWGPSEGTHDGGGA